MRYSAYACLICLLTPAAEAAAQSIDPDVLVGDNLARRGDFRHAIVTYRRACDHGSDAGCFRLAYLYENGRGVRADPARATELHRRGCELAHETRGLCAQFNSTGH